MAQKVTLGGDRLGSGNKQKVELHNYEMTSFNLEQDFKSSMAPGVLYPFLKTVATNHGTFDIDLDSFVRTLPTVGPLFGSFKFQLDLFAVPFRLYQGILHNNPIKVGLNMDKIYLPKLWIQTTDGKNAAKVKGSNDYDYQINTSSLIKYLGLSGIGIAGTAEDVETAGRKIQCIPVLAYYDIFKNYYANKQEEYAYVITPGNVTTEQLTLNAKWNETRIPETTNASTEGLDLTNFTTNVNARLLITITSNIKLNTSNLRIYYWRKNGSDVESSGSGSINELKNNELQILEHTNNKLEFSLPINEWISASTRAHGLKISVYTTQTIEDPKTTADIQLTPFTLENIDDMRNALLSMNTIGEEFVLAKKTNSGNWDEESGTDQTGLPYSTLFKQTTQGITYNAFSQNGLVVKTYQSDLFNNWLDTEYIDGEGGISAISSVAVVNNKFTMDSLNLAEKIYEYLNRVLVAGGTYEDWQEATYGEGAVRKAETPMYVGGMSSEVMFEEVIATTEANNQSLGSLGGKGTQVGKNGGNNIHIKCDEPSYIIGIASLTPRICYSQGNDWDLTELDTMDDLHKPALDGIGFQNLMVEQFAWWDAKVNDEEVRLRHSAGKQIAWINYQTAVDKAYGDFAKAEGYAFMVLNRNYEINYEGQWINGVKDITTYIDPGKFNYAFADAELSAQNFWVQIHTKMTARRKMAGKQIPNL